MNREEMKQELLEKYGVEMWSEEKILAFRKTLLEWYDFEGRDHLPWRQNNDPYRIWVSEIMLQQTQVVTVIPYYNRFMALFPSIKELADAEEEVLLKAWEGLGYYSRVRNIQKAARQIMADYDGVFPNEPDEIIKLKGIGPYTAGAISSMAFNLPEPAVDGNVMRVFSRLFEIGEDIAKPATRKIFELLVRIVIDPERPGDFNQAIMDLGTDICAPKNPRPEESPIKAFNAAYQNGTMHLYPFKSKAKRPVPLTLQGIVIKSGDRYLFEQRPETVLLANFWTFPLVEEEWQAVEQMDLMVAEGEANELEKIVSRFNPTRLEPSIGKVNHVFSHRRWNIDVHVVHVRDTSIPLKDNMKWISEDEFPDYAFAVPQQKMWELVCKHQRNIFKSF